MQLRWVLLVFLAACGSRLVATDVRPVDVPDAQSRDAAAPSVDAGAPSVDAGEVVDVDASAPPSDAGSVPAADSGSKPGDPDTGTPTTPPPTAAGTDAGAAMSAACPGGVYPGGFSVRVAADVEVLRGCSRVAGNLAFQTAQLTTLDGVESLERVDGTLSIGPIGWTRVGVDQFQPSSLVHGLAALSNLRSVGELHLIGLTLDTLAPLSKLEQVDLIMIMELRQLKDLTGLERVNFKSLDLSRNSELRDVSALRVPEVLWAVSIYDAPKLESIAALAPLRSAYSVSLRRVGVRSLEGLRNLQEVEVLSIADCNALVDLTGLGTLGLEVGLSDNTALQALTGVVRSSTPNTLTLQNLPKLTALAGVIGPEPGRLTALTLDGVAALETLSELAGIAPSTLNLGNLSMLRDLRGLEGVRVATSVVLRNLPALSDPSGLSGLQRVEQNLDLSELPKVTSLSWLSKLEKAEVLSIGGLNGLVNLQGLSQLRSVNSLAVGSNLALTSLEGLGQLHELSGLWIGNPALTNLHGLEGLTRLNYLTVEGNEALLNFEGLSGVHALDTLWVIENPKLIDFSGLTLQTATSVFVERNASLSQLTGLQMTTAYSIGIESNPKLMSLSGLSSLQSVMYAPHIKWNSALPQCEVSQFLARLGYPPSPDANGPPGMCGP